MKSLKIKVQTVLLTLAVVLFLMQLSSLFIFPLPNSLRWFGDETWLMSEAKSQITTGIVRYPLAIGSTLEYGKGVVLSMTWLSSLLYGIPAALIHADPVMIGRIMTALLSLALGIALYACARRLGADRLSASVAVLLLVSSRTFFFASHSCRPDVLAGLIVISFVTTGTTLSRSVIEKSGLWWLAFGAIVAFLAVTSSIHLLTLLIPVSVFFVWKLSGSKRLSCRVEFAIGAMGMLGILVLIYYITTGNLTLFAPASGRVQFNDVLSSIPVLRPFSRSVQTANILIRIKQFAVETPQSFLLVLALPLFLTKNWWRESRHTFTIASLIVFLSWLLLQGAEITYLIHILPLLLLGLALITARILEHSKYQLEASSKPQSFILSEVNQSEAKNRVPQPSSCDPSLRLSGSARQTPLRMTSFRVLQRSEFAIKSLLAVAAIVVFVFGLRDAINAKAHAEILDRSNKSAITNISHAIARTWDHPGRPRVVSEPPALDGLSRITSIQPITDHFISFPLYQESLDSFLIHEHIDYIVLFNSPTYPKERSQTDLFYQQVHKSAALVDEEIGTIGDVGRDYFHDSPWKDTLLLFKINTIR